MPNLVKVTVNKIRSNYFNILAFSLFGQRKELSLICPLPPPPPPPPPLPKKNVKSLKDRQIWKGCFKEPLSKRYSCLGKASNTGKISETYGTLNKIYHNIL